MTTSTRSMRAEWAGDAAENARKIAREFEEYLKENRDEIEALAIYFNAARAPVRSDLRHGQGCAGERSRRTARASRPLTVWRAYAHLDDYKGENPINELTALVALVRRVCGLDETLTHHSDRVRRNFQDWILKRHAGAGEKFSEEQMDWLRMIRDHLATSIAIERDDLELAPFDAHGGLGRMYALFGDRMDDVMSAMNEALAA